MRALWATEWAFATAVAGAVASVAVFLGARMWGEIAGWIVGGAGVLVVAGLVAAVIVQPRITYRHFRYEVTEHGLYVAHGWLWRSWQIVPHARVQTVDTNAGPLHRLFGLVTVEVTTASASGGTPIPGLAPSVAAALVDELARRAELEEGT